MAFHLQRGLQREEEDFCERRPMSDSELGSVLLQILVVCADGHKLGEKSNHTIRTSSQFLNTEYLIICGVCCLTLYWYVGSSLFHGSGLLVLFQLNTQTSVKWEKLGS